MTDVTLILDRVQQDDAKAADEMLPLVYEEACRRADANIPNCSFKAVCVGIADVRSGHIVLNGSGEVICFTRNNQTARASKEAAPFRGETGTASGENCRAEVCAVR